jgi:O-antigen/teichoic acid export membrane protein
MNGASSFFLKIVPALFRPRLEALLSTPSVANSLWLISDRLLRMGVGLLVGVWVARYLGPQGYGQLSFAGSYIMVFSAIALFGLESLVVRELVTHPEERGALLGTTCLIRFVAGLSSYLLALALLLFIRPDDRLTFLLVAILGSSLLIQALDVTDLWFQSRVLSRLSVLSRSAAFLASSCIKVVMLLSGASLTAIAIATASEAVFAAVALLSAYRISGEQISTWRWSRTWLRTLFTESVPMVLSGIVLMVYLRIDQVMLGILASSSDVGQYAAAVRISEVWYFVPTAIVSSVFPGLVQLRSSDAVLFQLKVQKLYKLLAFLGYAIALPVTFLAPWLIQLLFGSDYQPAAPLLSVLIWAGLFANVSVVRNAHFIALGWGKALLWCTALGAVSNVLLNLVLIPRYGALGAAIATCISYWIAAHGACYTSATQRPVAAMIVRSLIAPRFW